MQDPEVTRFLTWRSHRALSDSEAVIDRWLTGWEAESQFSWFLFDKATGILIGSIALRRDDGGFNLGYVLARAWWGRGLMPEAVNAVTEWALSRPSVSRVTALCDVANHGSARVLEKCGFVNEGVMEASSMHPNISAEPRDCYLYVQAGPGDRAI